MNCLLLFIGVVFPPFGFPLVIGEHVHDVNTRYKYWGLNILLTICLWLPGVIHFLYYWIKSGHFCAD